MSVTGVTPAARELLLNQIEKLVASEVLRGSESLCRILRYLGDHAISNPGASVKEYQIATEVFARPPDFDARLDSTVRVQTGRLRSKLAEYYAGEGQADRLVVEIPRGAYALTFHERISTDKPAGFRGIDETRTSVILPVLPARPNLAAWIFGLIALGLAAGLLYVLTRPAPSEVKTENAAPALRGFWSGFIDKPEKPWVIFSNAEFVGKPRTGMRYFDPAQDSKEAILDHYTGVGEVLAVHELDRLFTSLNHGIRVKRGRLLSLDDAKNNDLIFIGSSSENLTLRDVPMTRDFSFSVVERGPRAGDLAIVNNRPRAGEAVSFLGTPSIPLTEDYSLIGLVPGINPGRLVLVLAGTTTIGTQAAVEFVCRASSVAELMTRLGKSQTSDPGLFEAVIRVKVSHGVPVQSEIMALHPRSN